MLGPRGSRLLRRVTRRDFLIGIPGSRARRPRRALRAHRGVRRRLPHAPADPRRVPHRERPATAARLADRSLLRAPGPGRRGSWRAEFRACDAGARRSASAAPGRSRLHNYPDTLREPAPRRGRRRPGRRAPHRPGDHRRRCATASAACRATTTSGACCACRRRRASRSSPGATPRTAALARATCTAATSTAWTSWWASTREPLPEGFGFSETAFRIFVLMASRRLKSDPPSPTSTGPALLLARGHALDRGSDDAGGHRRAPSEPARRSSPTCGTPSSPGTGPATASRAPPALRARALRPVSAPDPPHHRRDGGARARLPAGDRRRRHPDRHALGRRRRRASWRSSPRIGRRSRGPDAHRPHPRPPLSHPRRRPPAAG